MSEPYVLQIRLSPDERTRLEAVAAAAHLPLATWARAVILQHADEVRCSCGQEPGLHRIPGVPGLLGDHCLRATDWQLWLGRLPPAEAAELSRHIGALMVPRQRPQQVIAQQKPMSKHGGEQVRIVKRPTPMQVEAGFPSASLAAAKRNQGRSKKS